VKPRTGSRARPVEVIDSSPEVKLESLDDEPEVYETPDPPDPPSKRQRNISPARSLTGLVMDDGKPSSPDPADAPPRSRSLSTSETSDSSNDDSDSDESSDFDFGDVGRRVSSRQLAPAASRLDSGRPIGSIGMVPGRRAATQTRTEHPRSAGLEPRLVNPLSPVQVTPMSVASWPRTAVEQKEREPTDRASPQTSERLSNASFLADVLAHDGIGKWTRLVVDQAAAPGPAKQLLERARQVRPSSYVMGPAIACDQRWDFAKSRRGRQSDQPARLCRRVQGAFSPRGVSSQWVFWKESE